MMVDYARITGSFPAILDDAGTLETTVQICINASKLHPAGKDRWHASCCCSLRAALRRNAAQTPA